MLFQKIINYTVGTQLFVRRSSFVDFQECVCGIEARPSAPWRLFVSELRKYCKVLYVVFTSRLIQLWLWTIYGWPCLDPTHTLLKIDERRTPNELLSRPSHVPPHKYVWSQGDILGLSRQIVYQPITSLAFNLGFCNNLKVIGLNSGHIKRDQCKKALSLQGPGTCHDHASNYRFWNAGNITKIHFFLHPCCCQHPDICLASRLFMQAGTGEWDEQCAVTVCIQEEKEIWRAKQWEMRDKMWHDILTWMWIRFKWRLLPHSGLRITGNLLKCKLNDIALDWELRLHDKTFFSLRYLGYNISLSTTLRKVFMSWNSSIGWNNPTQTPDIANICSMILRKSPRLKKFLVGM